MKILTDMKPLDIDEDVVMFWSMYLPSAANIAWSKVKGGHKNIDADQTTFSVFTM